MTKPENSGTTSYEERLTEVKKQCEQYASKLGLKYLTHDDGAHEYLNLPISQLKSLTIEQCSEGAYALAQYAAFLHKDLNTHRMTKSWAERQLDYIVAHQFDQYGDKYSKYDVVKNRIVQGDSSARLLMKVISDAENIITYIGEVDKYIQTMSRRLDDLKFAKLKKHE